MVLNRTNYKTTASEIPVADIQVETPVRDIILGTKKFLYKEDVLNAHLDKVLSWWYGKKAAEGVGLNETYRCKYVTWFYSMLRRVRVINHHNLL